MRTVLSLFLVTAAFGAQASNVSPFPGKIHVWACHDVRHIADAGYLAGVVFNRGQLQASFSEQTFAGPRQLGAYAVLEMSNPMPGSLPVFVDAKTQGKQYRLTIGGEGEKGISSLRAMDSSGRFHSARLHCHRTK